MVIEARPFAAAGRTSDLRQMTAAEQRKFNDDRRWWKKNPESSVQFRRWLVNGDVLDGFEHATRHGQTVCGIGSDEIFVMRHHFRATSDRACPECVAALEANRY